MPRFRNITVACAMLLAGGMFCQRSALADETIYKSIGPRGEVTYALRPEPNAVHTETVRVETLTPEQQRAINRLRISQNKAEKTSDAHLQDLEARWRQADREIINALAAVRKTETDLQKGRTPLPGERSGRAGGGTRLTQAYFDRISELELAVEEAKQRLDLAYQARNALK